ncbi:MAG: hypothetical protein TU36_007235 [Vulcanisaeta sp. AZ3]|jgi:transcription initiation factor TFIIIB Brf1 subunit/transcription initiation factor TFIIB
MKCPYCGSSRIIERDGQYVCIDCASVLSSVYVYDTYTQASPLYNSDEIDLSPIWRSVERSIKKDNSLKLSIYKKLKIIDKRLRTKHESYSIYRAYECINFIVRSLGIDNTYAEEAKIIFRKIISKERMNNDRVRYYQAAIAAVLHVILTNNLPISTKLVINICKSRGHKLNFETVRESLMAIGVKYSLKNRVLAHVKSGLVRLFGDQWVNLYPKTEEFLNGLERSFVQSKSPINLAAAIIYCVSKREGRELRIEDVAEAAQVSPFTLRDYVYKLCP